MSAPVRRTSYSTWRAPSHERPDLPLAACSATLIPVTLLSVWCHKVFRRITILRQLQSTGAVAGWAGTAKVGIVPALAKIIRDGARDRVHASDMFADFLAHGQGR